MTINGIKAMLRLHHIDYVEQDNVIMALEPIAYSVGIWHPISNVETFKKFMGY